MALFKTSSAIVGGEKTEMGAASNMEQATRDAGKTKGDAMTFTDKKPTEPGAYWYKQSQDSKPLLVCVSETPEYAGLPEMVVSGRGMRDEYLSDIGGLWSSRLVPVEEVFTDEQVEAAYLEGLTDGLGCDLEQDEIDWHWNQRRARRVVEGKEGV